MTSFFLQKILYLSTSSRVPRTSSLDTGTGCTLKAAQVQTTTYFWKSPWKVPSIPIQLCLSTCSLSLMRSYIIYPITVKLVKVLRRRSERFMKGWWRVGVVVGIGAVCLLSLMRSYTIYSIAMKFWYIVTKATGKVNKVWVWWLGRGCDHMFSPFKNLVLLCLIRDKRKNVCSFIVLKTPIIDE